MAAVFGFLAVIAGAFAAHGLERYVSAERVGVFKTAADYQMYHALVLLGVGLLIDLWGGKVLVAAGWALVAGVVLFCGSLYLVVLADLGWLRVVTPFGGAGFLIGWLFLGVAAFGSRKGSPRSPK